MRCDIGVVMLCFHQNERPWKNNFAVLPTLGLQLISSQQEDALIKFRFSKADTNDSYQNKIL